MEELDKYINTEDIIIIACSAGPDSMCLYDIITKKYPTNKIIIAHVNHNIREVSKEEEDFLKDYVGSNHIFETTTLYENNHSEENLRLKRYQFFDKLVDQYKATVLLTAHHGDDLIETILMRLTRGSNLKGYSGIKQYINKNNHKLYRPLLKWSKDDILRYNEVNNIPYKIDESNNDTYYTRNRYRHNILPALKEENNDVHLKFYDFSKELEETNELVENITQKEFDKYYSNEEYNLINFNNNQKIIKRKIIEMYLSKIYQDDIKLIDKNHLNIILNMTSKKEYQQAHLPANIIIEKEYDILRIKKEIIEENYSIEFSNQNKLPNNYEMLITNQDDSKSNYYLRLNSEEINKPLTIRNYRNDDEIEIKNLDGHKKIKKIFAHEKVAKKDRYKHPVLVDKDNNILWLAGLKKSKFDKEKPEKYDIIIKYQKLVEEKER